MCSAIFPSLVLNPCRSKPSSCAGFCFVPPDEAFARGLIAFEQLPNPNRPGALAIDLRLFTRHESTHMFYLCLINWIGAINRILRMQLCCCIPNTNISIAGKRSFIPVSALCYPDYGKRDAEQSSRSALWRVSPCRRPTL